MKRWVTIAIIPLCFAAAMAPSIAARASSKSPIEIGPIKAEFEPAYFRTLYETTVRGDSAVVSKDLKIVWSLKLQLVDKAGAPDPLTAGSGAAVDLGCTNHGDLNQTTHIDLNQIEATKIGRLTTFVWHHPDPADSYPVGWYHCDHALQGPRGHQGLITVVVSIGKWKCVATYRGTNSSLASSPGTRDPNVKNGTASEPTCSTS